MTFSSAGTTPPPKENVMSWFILFVAGLLEIAWAVGLKYTQGFTRLWPSLGTIAAMAASLVLLGLAMKSLPLGTAYAVWVGIGVVGAAVLGILLFDESTHWLRLASLALIALGVVGLKLASGNGQMES
jgi:quaternary ammonium compound-resistance protein SugE